MFRKLCSCSLLWLAACQLDAQAFDIKPVDNEKQLVRSLGDRYRWVLAHLSNGTHEELTALALECAESPEKSALCTLDPVAPAVVTHFDRRALTAGVRWNDDPNNYFPARHEAMWLICLQAAKITPKKITPRDPIEYRSHYGDLQFLHGMATQKQNPLEVQREVLEWAQFAYDVAVGVIAPSNRLSELESTYPFVRHFTGTGKQSWQVKTLFSNIGGGRCRDPGNRTVQISAQDVPSLALGALLHTVQDSYSHSHVERTPHGVATWLDYRLQNTDCHGREDKKRANDEQSKPAINWGAWLIRNAMLKTDWATGVRPTLASDVFALDTDLARQSDDGGYRTDGPKCQVAALQDTNGA